MHFLYKNYGREHPMERERKCFRRTQLRLPRAYAMFAACGLGIGFLVRFLIALGGAGERSKGTHLLRLRNAQPTAVTVHRVVGDRWFPVNAATPISMGVLRITTALSSSPILENKPVGAERAHIVYPARVQECRLGASATHGSKSSP